MNGKITIEFLLKKISPMAVPEDVVAVREKLMATDMEKLFIRSYRGGTYIVFRLKDIWPLFYPNVRANLKTLARLASSLQANFYERSALNGDMVFVKEVNEYRDFGY